MPSTTPIGDALDGCAPLERLRLLMQDSQARFDAVRAVLPAALVPHVRPGPIDEAQCWALLVSNAAVAAKLRQFMPLMEARLRQAGWQGSSIRIRVQSG